MKPVTQLKTPYNQNLSENMLNRLNQLQQVEILEIAKCNLIKIPPSLEELEGLMILTLSYNNIRAFAETEMDTLGTVRFCLQGVWEPPEQAVQIRFELARCEALERIVLAGVINLSHNRLTVLPNDFPRTAGKALSYVDLSYNQLTMVPSALMECGLRELRELNLSNRLTSPDKYELGDPLKKLRKLFLSFNELVTLPEDIGISEKLEKLRITSNQIKRLPYSILKLWKNATPPGQLEELLVDRNPLLVPTITAFEMESGTGGMNRAFELLQEHQKEDAQEKRRLSQQRALKDQEERPALPPPEEPIPEPMVMVADTATARKEESFLDRWYFGHCLHDQVKVMEIREAEERYLVRKRQKFMEAQKWLAQEEGESRGKVSDQMKIFLNNNCYQEYRGRIKTQDIDLFYIHFMMTAKQVHESARAWFRKFVPGGRSYMTKQEWCELCLNHKLDVRQKMMDELWDIIYSDSIHPHGLPEAHFIAASQIHDIEERDPYIVRIADALCLDYFEETVDKIAEISAPNNDNMAERLGSFKANLALSPLNSTDRRDLTDELSAPVGLRPATEQLTLLRPGGAMTGAMDSTLELKTLLKKVSLSEYDCQQVNKLDGIEDRSVAESERSVDSAELSDDAPSDMTEFDAQAFLLDELEETQAAATSRAPSRVAINSDSALRRLMEVPVKEIWEGRRQAREAVEVSGPFKRQVLNKPQRGSRTQVGELAVRRALRDVYRNMPFHEFSSFIRENKPETAGTLWHDDDPAFRYAVGAAGHNKYTCRLLEIMGFVHLNDKYWIWPLEHLKSVKHGKCWAHLQVPSDCPGMLRWGCRI
ncbi:unnamed protein product [Cladocopium goreaui]|uniref:Leucine-rich repeat-containing protein 8D n=1 Tax=Cladocopium goreaui TaxID=2562237 RepID=A0A9P1CT08_9DINO|nr:unnamed protein product [Cladocopium goreaui]